jgi:hypothetical protein
MPALGKNTKGNDMRSKPLTILRPFLALIAICACGIQSPLLGDVVKYDMAVKGSIYDSSSWIGGVLPGSNDVVLVQNTVTGESVTLDITNDLYWAGIYIDAPVSKDLQVTLDGVGSLYLGNQGIETSSGNIKTINIKVPVYLTADQIWAFNSGTFGLYSTTYFQGHTMYMAGRATQEIRTNMVGPGTLLIQGSSISFLDHIYVEDIDVIMNMPSMFSSFTFNDWSSDPLVKSLSIISDGNFKIYSNSEWQCTTNTLGSDIMLNNGFFIVTMDRARSPKMFLSAPGIQREHGMFLFRGRELGETSISNVDTQAVNIVFDNAPDLLGNPAGSGSTMPIMEATVVDPYYNGYGEGFATYDSEYGVRLLDPVTEYATSIIDGQSTLDNISLDTQGTGPITAVLEEPLTIINSLSMTEYGAAGMCGVTVTSAPNATLRINSGMIFAYQYMTNTPTTDDALVLAVPNLDFNGKDGVIFVRETKYGSNGYNNAPFRFRSIPTNISDGGLYFYSTLAAYIYFDGDFTNTYTGPITLGGRPYVRLDRSIDNNAIVGTLIIDGASCQDTNNQLDDDTADVVIKSGSLLIKSGASNSGNSGWETFRDLTMYGGTFTLGGGGGGGASMRNCTLLGGDMKPNRGTLTEISGDVIIAGGELILSVNTDSNRSGVKVDVAGNLTISNTLNAAWGGLYEPISMGYSYYRNPAYVAVTNKVSVYGNAENEKGVAVTRSYSTDSRTMLGELRLKDSVEFYITDGAAEYDFDVDASFADYDTIAGELVKTGEGTLRMTASTNVLSYGIQIDAGRIVLDGGVSNDVAVATGAVIAGNGSIDGNLAFASDAIFESSMINISTSAVLNVSGTVTGAGDVIVDVLEDQPEGEWKIMTASSFDASFVSTNPDWGVYSRNNNTELWLSRKLDSLFIIE